MSENKSKKIILILAAGIALVAGAWLGSYKEQHTTLKAEKIQGVILPQGKTIRPFQLTNHNEQVFTQENLKDHWSMLFVGYTQCPDICPAALSVLKQVHKLMSEQSLRAPQMIFISIDPERDSYASLSEYVRYFNEEFIGVTGELDQLKNIAQQLSVSFMKAPGSSGNIDNDDYLMDHGTSFMLINPQGKLQSFLTAPHDPVQIIDSIKHSQDYYNASIRS